MRTGRAALSLMNLSVFTVVNVYTSLNVQVEPYIDINGVRSKLTIDIYFYCHLCLGFVPEF